MICKRFWAGNEVKMQHSFLNFSIPCLVSFRLWCSDELQIEIQIAWEGNSLGKTETKAIVGLYTVNASKIFFYTSLVHKEIATFSLLFK